MKKVLTVAAVAEVATGMALLILLPSLVEATGEIGSMRYGLTVPYVNRRSMLKVSLFR